jgi:hypothetical protein
MFRQGFQTAEPEMVHVANHFSDHSPEQSRVTPASPTRSLSVQPSDTRRALSIQHRDTARSLPVTPRYHPFAQNTPDFGPSAGPAGPVSPRFEVRIPALKRRFGGVRWRSDLNRSGGLGGEPAAKTPFRPA